MDDLEKDNEELEGGVDEEELDDEVVASEKKFKGEEDHETDSLDTLADEEDETLPEDNFDDQDLW